ncbi:MAG TPA: HAD-IB family hydrolase [Anaeromyxobacteraceae bacterium]|nr:HAD-IB family hydrolase [Anaeromyxobacteraceae bacterium]
MVRAAFFDLDGTLLTVNSARLWLLRERRLGRLRLGQVVHATFMLAQYRLGLLDMESALRASLVTLRGQSEEYLRRETRAFWREAVRPFVAPGALAVLARHRAAGDRLVLLTSSSRYAAEIAGEEFGLDHLLFQHYELRDGRFTGAPLSPICYGPGKVAVAEAFARETGVELGASSFYSDSSTDLPMLERVGHPYAVHPDPRLRRVARSRGWPILDWSGAAGGPRAE